MNRSVIFCLFALSLHLPIQAQESIALVEQWNLKAHDFYDKQPDSIIAYGQKALELSLEKGDNKGIAVAFDRLSRGYLEKGELTVAKKWCSKAIAAARKAHAPRYEADAYLQLSLIEIGEIQYAEAFDHALRAMELFKSVGEQKGMVMAYMRIGQIYYKNNEFDKAIENYKKGLRIAEQIQDKTDEGYLYSEMGTALKNKVMAAGKGNFREAIQCYEKAVTILTEQGIHERWVTYQKISDLYATGLQNTKKAMEYNQKALELVQQISNLKGTCEVLLARAALLNTTEKVSEANEALRRVEAIASRENYVEMLTQVYYQRALSWMVLNQPDSAQLYMEAYGLALKNKLDGLKELEIKYKTAEQEKENLKLTLETSRQRLDLAHKLAIIQQQQWETRQQKAQADSARQQMQIQRLQVEQEKSKTIAAQQEVTAARNKILGIVAAAFMLLLGGWQYLHLRRVRREQMLKLEFARQMAELETRTLRAQMNPHFIFNALSSIKKFVLTNDADSADAYLSKFARLMRLILENSRETLVPLRSEVELLENYIQLERLRSAVGFDYTIQVERPSELEALEIPSLVLQPFVENAIVHGLNNRNGPGGLLTISFKKVVDTLHITIEDNGVGRHQSESMKSQDQRSRHRSFGIDITNKRLEAFAAHYGRKPEVKITDLGQDCSTPPGTRIDIEIPVDE